MKRTGFKFKPRKPLKRTKIRVVGHSTVSEDKRTIQELVRAIVIKRDGGCILRNVRRCGGDAEGTVWQGDHLITRSNSATYADTRLIVCVCRPCHFWKKYHKEEYDGLIRQILTKERVLLWQRCEADSWKPRRVTSYDWKMEIVMLKKELQKYEN